MDERIKKALEIADRSGGVEGDHHKAWVIDQMVRALTGCPMVTREAKDVNGLPYSYEDQGESDEYRDFVRARLDDEYGWDVGIPP